MPAVVTVLAVPPIATTSGRKVVGIVNLKHKFKLLISQDSVEELHFDEASMKLQP